MEEFELFCVFLCDIFPAGYFLEFLLFFHRLQEVGNGKGSSRCWFFFSVTISPSIYFFISLLALPREIKTNPSSLYNDNSLSLI